MRINNITYIWSTKNWSTKAKGVMLDSFKAIKIENPSSQIIRQIRELIRSGQLVAGDRLPPERKLAEKFGVGRSVVRDAIRKLEFYGIVKTLPQSGTVIAGLGVAALEGLISDVLKMEHIDYKSLVETRLFLEVFAAGSAAQNRTVDDLVGLETALTAYEGKIKEGAFTFEEDLLFHVKIAEASGNSVLKSLMLVIVPDLIKSFSELNICTEARVAKTIDEHREILRHIAEGDKEKAEEAMRHHLRDILAIDPNNTDT